ERGRSVMPEKDAVKRAKKLKREGKSPSTQASEFVREEMHAYKEGKGPKSPRQAIAIGLSEARRAGVDLEPPRIDPSFARRPSATSKSAKRAASFEPFRAGGAP